MVKDKVVGVIYHSSQKYAKQQKFPSSEQARIKGYLKTWNSAKMLLRVSFLSISFQKDDINPVDSVRCMAKTMARMDLFMGKGFEKLPNVWDLLSKIEERDSEVYFQGVKLSDFENAKDIVSKKRITLLGWLEIAFWSVLKGKKKVRR